MSKPIRYHQGPKIVLLGPAPHLVVRALNKRKTNLSFYMPPSNTASTQANAPKTSTNTMFTFRSTMYVFTDITLSYNLQSDQFQVSTFEDRQFFDNVRSQHTRCKGILRKFFSVWVYGHCDFYNLSANRLCFYSIPPLKLIVLV